MLHWNVVPKKFRYDHISQGVWEVVKTTYQCIVVLQLRGEGPESRESMGHIYKTFFFVFLPIYAIEGGNAVLDPQWP